uniref:Lcl C-terminal domain-containing protein n=1 Tax=Aliarcobacter sp. TaxID=2321116 RepID=UPI00404890F8
MKYLFIILIFFSFIEAKIYRDGSKNIVIDNEAKLMWVDDVSVIKILHEHEDAINYCDNLSYLGFANWRLPNIEEFELIVDKKNTRNYINRAFKYNVPDGYWAYKAHWRTFWFYADYMHFVSGTAYFDSRHKTKYVRCVRNY